MNKAKAKNNPGTGSKTNISRTGNSLWLVIILLLTFIVYLPVLKNGFVNWDDDQYILENTLIRTIDLQQLFSQFFMGNYHPLTMFILAIEYKIFGLSPVGYHTVNLLLHILNVFLVYRTVLLLSEKEIVALISALLFGVHPLHVESVAWISELKDLLYCIFFLLSLLCYLKYLKNGSRKFYALSLTLFLPALLSKAMAASLPLVLILTDYLKGKKINYRSLIDKIPFLILSVIFGLVAIEAQKSSGSISENSFGFFERIIFAGYGFINYIVKLILPVTLSAFYPYPIKSGESIPIYLYIYPLLVMVIAAFVFATLKSTKKIIFAFGFFTATIILVLQLIPVGGAVMADRYSYLPSIAIFYLAGEGFHYLLSIRKRPMAVFLIVLFTVFFSVKTYARCDVWKSGMTLWNDVIDKHDNVALAYNSRGVLYDEMSDYINALSDYTKAIQLNPKYDKAFNNRGNLYMKSNKSAEALKDYSFSISLRPDFYGAYKNRGNLYASINLYDSAYADYEAALALKSNDAETYFYRANLLQKQNKINESLEDYARALKHRPNYPEAYFNRGVMNKNNSRLNEAIEDFSMAIRIYPGYVDAFLNRGNVLQSQNKFEEALKDFDSAINLQPDNPRVYFNKGKLLGDLKKYDEAIGVFSTAIRLKNDYALAYFGRGVALCNVGRKNDGCNDLRKAISLGFQPAMEAFNTLCR